MSVGEALPHESAALHVTGHALYTDDLVGRTRDVLHAHPVPAPHTHARVTALRADPAYDVPGVVRVLKVAAVHDSGVILNRIGADGQVAGRVVMGVGPAISEGARADDKGRTRNPPLPRGGAQPAGAA